MPTSAGDGVQTIAVRNDEETRPSLAITDEATGGQFRFSLPGLALSQSEVGALMAMIVDAAPIGGFVVLSGSAAPGIGDDHPARIQQAISDRTEKLIVDTSKAPLAQLISNPATPFLAVRVDRREAEQSAGYQMDSVTRSVDFASELVTRGVARIIVCGRGAEGSVMVTEGARFFCRSVRVPVRSKIGAGDAFVGAMTLSLARNEPPEQSLRWGVAAASAIIDRVLLCFMFTL